MSRIAAGYVSQEHVAPAMNGHLLKPLKTDNPELARRIGWADGRLLNSLSVPDANASPRFPNIRTLFEKRTP